MSQIGYILPRHEQHASSTTSTHNNRIIASILAGLEQQDHDSPARVESQEKECIDPIHGNYIPSNIGSMVCPPANIDPIELDTFQIATEMAEKVLALPDKDWDQVQDKENQNLEWSQIGNKGMEERQNNEVRGQFFWDMRSHASKWQSFLEFYCWSEMEKAKEEEQQRKVACSLDYSSVTKTGNMVTKTERRPSDTSRISLDILQDAANMEKRIEEMEEGMRPCLLESINLFQPINEVTKTERRPSDPSHISLDILKLAADMDKQLEEDHEREVKRCLYFSEDSVDDVLPPWIK